MRSNSTPDRSGIADPAGSLSTDGVPSHSYLPVREVEKKKNMFQWPFQASVSELLFSFKVQKSSFFLMAGPLPPPPVLMARPLKKDFFCGFS